MKKIDVKSLQDNVFSLIGDRWMLITAGTAERCNTMTASWAPWHHVGKPSVTAYIRQSRYTKNLWTGRSCLPSPSLTRRSARP